MENVQDIIEKYELPREYFDAIWEAYEAGAKRGFIEGAINQFNSKILPEVEPA